MLFSILVANYNNGKYFKDCYDSLIAQTNKNWECIIVDDCSTDDSIELIKKIIKDDSRFKIYQNNENKGCGFTKRRCVEIASGEVCGFVDPDDAITENAIETMIKEHTTHTEYSLVYSNIINCDSNLQSSKVQKKSQIINNDSLFCNFNGVISHFVTFKNNIYKETIGIDPFLQRAVDQDLYLKLYEKGPVKYIDKDFYFYRIHDGGISTNTNGEKANFWHWIVLTKMMERRNINLENIFVEKMIAKQTYNKEVEKNNYFKEKLKKSRWLKLGNQLGLFKLYKDL